LIVLSGCSGEELLAAAGFLTFHQPTELEEVTGKRPNAVEQADPEGNAKEVNHIGSY
jgi:hypothetical protein